MFPQRIQKGETPPTSVEERIRAPRPAGAKPSLGASLALDQPFSRLLLGLIDQKGLSDPEVYHRANIDRRLFSKLRQDGYMPSKRTALALCVALEMTAEEAQRLLVAAGFALSRSILADVIVRYHLDRGIFDVFRINDVLYAYDQPLLGGSA